MCARFHSDPCNVLAAISFQSCSQSAAVQPIQRHSLDMLKTKHGSIFSSIMNQNLKLRPPITNKYVVLLENLQGHLFAC